MAATRFVDELTQRTLGRYSVIVIGAEPRLSYNRVLLSSLLAGEVDEGAIELKPREWWNRRGVTTLDGQAVASIERASQTVTLANGLRFPYSKLVLATGSKPIMLAKPGMDLQNVLSFRDLADVAAMRGLMRKGARAAVIGGGLLGLEAAYGLAKAGVKVTLVHLMDRLMERQLDHRAAALLTYAIAAKGVDVLLGADTKQVLGEESCHGSRTQLRTHCSGRFRGLRGGYPAANATRARCGTRRSIAASSWMISSRPAIPRSLRLVNAPSIEALSTVSLNQPMNRRRSWRADSPETSSACYAGSILATNLKVSGVSLFSAGEFMESSTDDILLFEDHGAGVYKKLVIENHRLKGAVLFGDTADGLWYQGLIREGADVSPFARCACLRAGARSSASRVRLSDVQRFHP